MGMYDIINGEQVKCFGVTCYYNDSISPGVSQMGGLLRGYKNGSKIPYKTYYYNYTPNFCIVDTHPYEEEEIAIIHIIKDGKVKETVRFDDLNEEDLKNSNIVLNYWGDELSIRTKDEILCMIEDGKYFREQQQVLASESHKIIFKDIPVLIREMRTLNNDSEEYKSKHKEYEKLQKQYEDLKEKENPLVEELREARISKYYKKQPEIFYKCEKLGEYIDAAISYSKKGKNENLDKMKDFIFDSIRDKELVNAYCDFQEITEKQFNNIIKKVRNLK